MPNAGQILIHKNFVYENGASGIKLCIVLNTCGDDDKCLVLKTTSQPKWYAGVKKGCNLDRKVHCIRKDCDQWFKVDTFVQLDNVYPIIVSKLLNDGQITFVSSLHDHCLTTLKKCLRSRKDDIPEQFWKLIYAPTPPK